MARVVDTIIKLPRQWASGGAEIKNTTGASDHGLRTAARAQNTLYDQHRGVLVDDADWNSEASILGATLATNLRWKAPLWGGASLTETATVGLWMRGNGGAGAGVVRFSDGTNTADVAVPTGSAATTFKATATLSIIDNAEAATISATYISGTIGAVHSAFAYYDRTRTTLPASLTQYYPGTTFCAQEFELYAEGFPVTSAMAYTMRDNAAELYSRVGAAITSSWGNAPLTAGQQAGFVKPVPENVTTLRLFIDGQWTGSLGGYLITTTREVKVGTFGALRAFSSAIDLDVSGLDVISVLVDVGTNGLLHGVSGYWMARSLPA